MTDFQRLLGCDLERANVIYAELSFAASDPDRDRTFGLLGAAGQPVVLGRLQRHADGTVELGGYWVHPAHRSTGLARQIVRYTLEQVQPGTRAWCIPLDHLVGFYESLGLSRAACDTVLPDSIQVKTRDCAATFDGHGGKGRYADGVVLYHDA